MAGVSSIENKWEAHGRLPILTGVRARRKRPALPVNPIKKATGSHGTGGFDLRSVGYCARLALIAASFAADSGAAGILAASRQGGRLGLARLLRAAGLRLIAASVSHFAALRGRLAARLVFGAALHPLVAATRLILFAAALRVILATGQLLAAAIVLFGIAAGQSKPGDEHEHDSQHGQNTRKHENLHVNEFVSD
jgi:hypothetical protein